MCVQYQASGVAVSQIISKREVSVAFDTESARITIHLSDRLAAYMLLRLQELSLPRPDASDVTELQ
jgi:hypothetical protein